MLDYTAPSTVEEAIRILAEAPGTAKVLSGGTDLLVQLRSGRTKPDLIVDIKKIPGMSGIRCNASPAADSVPALIAARATCVVVGANGRREVPVESIPTGPGRTSLKPGEFIVEFHLPKRPARSADAYLRFIPRTEMDIAVVGVRRAG